MLGPPKTIFWAGHRHLIDYSVHDCIRHGAHINIPGLFAPDAPLFYELSGVAFPIQAFIRTRMTSDARINILRNGFEIVAGPTTTVKFVLTEVRVLDLNCGKTVKTTMVSLSIVIAAWCFNICAINLTTS